MKPNRRFAVTGGIGSGKSTVLAMLKARGYLVYSCDEISHALWQEEAYLSGLARLFPDCAPEGVPDRKLLSRRVFSDPEARMRLDAYAHPRIMEELLRRMEGEVSFAEVPLLFEGGYQALFDGVIVVTRPLEARVAAVGARDGLSEKEVLSRVEAQLRDEARCGERCYFLSNDGSAEALSKALDALLGEMLEIST